MTSDVTVAVAPCLSYTSISVPAAGAQPLTGVAGNGGCLYQKPCVIWLHMLSKYASLTKCIQLQARQSLTEQHKLMAEKNALIETVKRLNREVAKLEHFKRNLLQQLQDDTEVRLRAICALAPMAHTPCILPLQATS